MKENIFPLNEMISNIRKEIKDQMNLDLKNGIVILRKIAI